MRRALRPLNAIPVDFQICADAHLARSSGPKDVGQIEENRLLPARRKTQIVLRGNPSAATVGDFQAQTVSAPAVTLRDSNIHRRLGVVNRSLGDQVKWPAFRHVVAELDFEIMISRDALVLAAPKTGQRSPIQSVDDVSDILSRVINCPGNLVRPRNGRESQLQWRDTNRSSTKISVPAGWSTVMSAR